MFSLRVTLSKSQQKLFRVEVEEGDEGHCGDTEQPFSVHSRQELLK